MALTPKQQLFITEYLVDLNGTQAAIRAGYSAKTAKQIAEQNLKRPEVAKAVQTAMSERAERVGRTADDVLRDIASVKSACMEMVVDADKGTKVMVDAKAALKALELEGRHLKMFTDKREVSGSVSFNLSYGN